MVEQISIVPQKIPPVTIFARNTCANSGSVLGWALWRPGQRHHVWVNRWGLTEGFGWALPGFFRHKKVELLCSIWILHDFIWFYMLMIMVQRLFMILHDFIWFNGCFHIQSSVQHLRVPDMFEMWLSVSQQLHLLNLPNDDTNKG